MDGKKELPCLRNRTFASRLGLGGQQIRERETHGIDASTSRSILGIHALLHLQLALRNGSEACKADRTALNAKLPCALCIAVQAWLASQT